MSDVHEGKSPLPQKPAARDKTRDRRFVRTEKAIRDAFLRLIEEQDFHKITVTAIAREADIDRKTFYLHYETVDAVADAIVREKAETFVRLLREGSFFDRNTVDVTDLFFSLSAGPAPDLLRTRKMYKHITAEEMLEKIEAALTEALIEEDRLDLTHARPYVSYCVSFFVAGLFAIYRRWLASDSAISLDEISAVANIAASSGVNGLRQSISLEPGVAGSSEVGEE
ncbi:MULTISPECIES: TetR/AcrR family transcriptional regulator [Gordonibacter]|uniref:TetR/AcrR family transcriptional regulator n=1 Tax=Gordonibacter faecis TaxID=3047475 RepID=A0ABT7DJQ8_9ACTN|nr:MULTISPECIES: TetR/AcrR family transcriptional regulator [unclassified Gordonibacter]MDJ1649755.1 TetR/AcrR family transcriptional regulator [Gordonibacter sp. KGMB12511]HIW76558.1 TetR/AcrR family transcriptional regulator [Candidatus Gordonibacter avicola]